MSHRRVKVLWIAAAVTMAILLLPFFLLRDPTYRGKPMRVWFDEIYAQGIENAEAQATLMHFEKDAVPVLRRELRAHDSNLKLRVIQFLARQKIFSIQFAPAEERHRRAMRLCGVLGPGAREAIPELTRFLVGFSTGTEDAASALARIGEDAVAPLSQAATNVDHRVREMAVVALGVMQDKAHAATAVLAQAMTDPVQKVRYYAAGALGQTAADVPLAVPALVSGLKDPDEAVRRCCAQSLGTLGGRASSAVPALLQATRDQALLVRLSARTALEAIDPEAALPALRIDQEIPGETPKNF